MTGRLTIRRTASPATTHWAREVGLRKPASVSMPTPWPAWISISCSRIPRTPRSGCSGGEVCRASVSPGRSGFSVGTGRDLGHGRSDLHRGAKALAPDRQAHAQVRREICVQRRIPQQSRKSEHLFPEQSRFPGKHPECGDAHFRLAVLYRSHVRTGIFRAGRLAHLQPADPQPGASVRFLLEHGGQAHR